MFSRPLFKCIYYNSWGRQRGNAPPSDHVGSHGCEMSLVHGHKRNDSCLLKRWYICTIYLRAPALISRWARYPCVLDLDPSSKLLALSGQLSRPCSTCGISNSLLPERKLCISQELRYAIVQIDICQHCQALVRVCCGHHRIWYKHMV